MEALVRAGDNASFRHRRFIATADAAVFQTTKVLHHRLHGVAAGPLPEGAAERAYLAFGKLNAGSLMDRLQPDDLVVLHDPQTLPMAAHLSAQGVGTVWRCHIGTNQPNQVSATTWSYLRRLWPPGMVLVFSTRELVPPQAQEWPVVIIPPSVDPSALKNVRLLPADVTAVLKQVGLLDGRPPEGTMRVVSEQPLGDDPVILQVSRWDPLKDMPGVLRGFAESALSRTARLVLCGPSPAGVMDDPEAATVLHEVVRQHAGLPAAVRRRVHLVCPDLADERMNALLVNALQHRAAVVVQKSRQEGFGLTVTEAMFKGRPVVATRVGGITSQLTHERTGLLLDDPDDLPGMAALVGSLLASPGRAASLGAAAGREAAARFTTAREIADHHCLYQRVADGGHRGPA